jgi:uncharacterized repeat protein (TIGR03803 family)
VYSFCGQGGTSCTDGANPAAGLINVGGTLYGTTAGGGAENRGTVFSYALKTHEEMTLYPFCQQTNCADGAVPYAGLINVGGTLYGTTLGGGLGDNGNGGTVFSIKP